MKTSSRTPTGAAHLYPFLFLLGMGAGFAWAMRLDEERRRRWRKALFELRELPFRLRI